MKKATLFLVLMLSVLVQLVEAQTISTVAGTGVFGFNGDGILATTAQIAAPEGLAFDAAGNFFMADTGLNRARKVGAVTGLISTVAGTGVYGFNGDGIPATGASLAAPTHIAFDSTGNLYIAGDLRVRKVDAVTGFITTFVGTGVGLFNGDGQPGTATNLANPHGLAFDAAGNLFIADSSQQRIRRVDAVTGLVSTVAGTGVGGFNGDAVPATAAQLLGPFALAFDPAGNLYIADLGNQRIRKVDAVLGLISTVAGMGAAGFNGDGILATTAQLNNPTGIVFDRVGNLFIADQSNNRVRLVDAATGLISTIAGTGVPGFNGDGIPATSAQLNLPVSLAFDQLGNLYIGEVGDPNSRRIRKVICPIGDDDSDGVCNGFEEELEQPASEQVSIQVPQTKVFVVPTQKAAGGSSLTGAVVGVPPVGSWIVVALVVLIGLCFIVYNVTHSTRRLK